MIIKNAVQIDCQTCRSARMFSIHINTAVIIPGGMLIKVSCPVCHFAQGKKFTFEEWGRWKK